MKKWFLGIFVIVASLSLFSMTTDKKDNTNTDEDGIVLLDTYNKDGSVRTFDDVLAQYKGKVVYVDFWASWCGPCRQQFPHAKKLHTKFNDDEVVFLYISFDRDENSWKRAVNQLKMKGDHFFPAGDEAKKMSQKYDIGGIPRYFLVGKDGTIANDDAPRPSSKSIAGAIDKLRNK
jgi:thiol-disulfide isomerase/thioredoxin